MFFEKTPGLPASSGEIRFTLHEIRKNVINIWRLRNGFKSICVNEYMGKRVFSGSLTKACKD